MTGSISTAINNSQQDIASMDKRYRTNFINSLSGHKSANLIATLSSDGVSNVAMFSSVVHLGADPALVGFINRPHNVERQTLENILNTGYYTINHVTEDFYQQAHQTAARYLRNTSEFQATGLTEQYTNNFKAPYVAQSHIKLGVQFLQKTDITLNQTILVIGQIVDVFCPDDWIFEDGKIDIHQAQSLSVTGLDEYHTSSSLGRLPYPKP